MENNETQNQIGMWDRVTTEDYENLPKVSFEINIPVEVIFKTDRPKEVSSENGSFCIFDVVCDGSDKVIITSAWTLLRELKKISPLKDRNVLITKKIDKGKQYFIAVEKPKN